MNCKDGCRFSELTKVPEDAELSDDSIRIMWKELENHPYSASYGRLDIFSYGARWGFHKIKSEIMPSLIEAARMDAIKECVGKLRISEYKGEYANRGEHVRLADWLERELLGLTLQQHSKEQGESDEA